MATGSGPDVRWRADDYADLIALEQFWLIAGDLNVVMPVRLRNLLHPPRNRSPISPTTTHVEKTRHRGPD